MNKSITTVVILFLLIGILYRLLLTANGNLLFNMDNGRDMVDVREMVVLGKIRLTGPTSAIEGFYNYAFNPNPVVLLTPLLIYRINKYLERGKTVFSILTFLLAGLFFNFEMNTENRD